MIADRVPAPARIGTTIGGKYLVRRLLGIGGMGAVYEAENTWTKRRVAIKCMRIELAHNDDATQRFFLEARSASHASHPNVVDVLDMGRDVDGSLYIVQELLKGDDLRACLDKHGRLPPSTSIALITPVMRALASMHARGIVHRDVKPEHVILVEDETGQVTPKLIDFGIATTGAGDPAPRAGHPVGTPHYMSPEQATGDVEIDARSDVWSLGAVLYEMLSGRCPLDATSYELLVVALLTTTPDRIERIAPHVPPALADVVHMALEPDRDRRFASMEAFLDALNDVASECNDEGFDATPPHPQHVPAESAMRMRAMGNRQPTLDADVLDDAPTDVHAHSAAAIGPARGRRRAPPVRVAPDASNGH